MSPLDDYFMTKRPLITETAVWGHIQLRVQHYLSDQLPPAAYVSSARTILYRGSELLLVQQPDGKYHILPGGRCDPGETMEQTARRELLEETGWHAGPLRQIGVIRFTHLTPKPADYPYPYPTFLQVIFAGQPTRYDAAAVQTDQYVMRSMFVPQTAVSRLNLSPSNLLYLNSATL